MIMKTMKMTIAKMTNKKAVSKGDGNNTRGVRTVPHNWAKSPKRGNYVI